MGKAQEDAQKRVPPKEQTTRTRGSASRQDTRDWSVGGVNLQHPRLYVTGSDLSRRRGGSHLCTAPRKGGTERRASFESNLRFGETDRTRRSASLRKDVEIGQVKDVNLQKMPGLGG